VRPVPDAIPTVDLAAFLAGTQGERRRIAAAVDDICRSLGFLVIDNHGVPRQVAAAAWTAARQFFDLPLAAKLKCSAHGSPRGYFPFEEESLARTRGVAAPPDRKEAFSSGPLAPPAGHEPGAGFDFFYGENRWPTAPAGFRDAWIAYYRAMEALGAQVMRLLAAALSLDEDYFAPFHRHHLAALRALHYPAGPAAAAAGQQRAGAHSDYGSVTILKPDPEVGGLEVRLPGGDWVAAPVVTDAFIVNLGDLMARWTNDRWVSTLHRVADPEPDAGGELPRRQSIACFMNPDYDAEIATIPTCLAPGEQSRYAPVQAGDYLLAKFRAANADAAARDKSIL